MFRSLFRELTKNSTTTSMRPARPMTRRPTLEALEDRLVLSTARQFGSVLDIVASPGTILPRPSGPIEIVRQITLEADAKDHAKLDVFDGTTLLGQFTISSIKTANITVAGLDAIDLNDSNGVPFAINTGVNLFGTGVFGNSLNLFGSQPINADIAGNSAEFSASTATQTAFLRDGGVGFDFFSGIDAVSDEWANSSLNSSLFVDTVSRAVTLSGQDGVSEQFSGLADGGSGPGTLTFANKAEVILEERVGSAVANAATVTLNATKADPTLKVLDVEFDGSNETVNINATPSGVTTIVGAEGANDRVNVRANSGAVTISGGSTTTVELGSNDTFLGQSVTSGIKANVAVFGGFLEIADGGNAATQEHVTVTESTVSGAGLFGSSAAVVSYHGATGLLIFTGRLANTYFVEPSKLLAHFSSPITINDSDSSAGLSVIADVDAGSGLDLSLFNFNPPLGTLIISAPDGTVNPLKPTVPNGTETVTFPGGLTSKVTYDGFDVVEPS